MLEFFIDPASSLHNPVFASGKKLLFYCAGRRMRLGAASDADLRALLETAGALEAAGGAVSLGEIGSLEGSAYPGFHNGALVCLGSPHHGAPLERGGSLVDLLLGIGLVLAHAIRAEVSPPSESELAPDDRVRQVSRTGAARERVVVHEADRSAAARRDAMSERRIKSSAICRGEVLTR